MGTQYTKELLESALIGAGSVSDVVRNLDLPVSSGNHKRVSDLLQVHGLSTSRKSRHHGGGRGKRPDEDVFCENSTYPGSYLGARLVKDHGWEYKCAICGIDRWLGLPITLHIDHINGVSNDHRFENLRFLCPNCHQQTPTWGNKSKEKKARKIRKKKCADCDAMIGMRSTRCRACAANDRIGNLSTNSCAVCAVEISSRANKCRSCAGMNRGTKANWPEMDVLASMVKETGYVAVAKVLGVSDSAVRKRLRVRGHNLTP